MSWLWNDPTGVLVLAFILIILAVLAGQLLGRIIVARRVRRFRRIVTERYGLDSNPVETKRPEENPRGNQDAR